MCVFFVVCFSSWSGGGQKGRNKYCKLVIGNVDNAVFNLDDTVLAWIQWSLHLGLYGFVVVVGMAMSILHLIGIRISLSIPHFSLVQGYVWFSWSMSDCVEAYMFENTLAGCVFVYVHLPPADHPTWNKPSRSIQYISHLTSPRVA